MSKRYRVTKQIHFCYGHRLMDYDGKCRMPHGHNALAEIELSTDQLDAGGMAWDFGAIKAVVKAWIDEHLDHKMLLRRDDPLVQALDGLGEPYFPMDDNPTAENIARLIFEVTAKSGLPVSQVRLWETPSSFAVYRPA